jgi:Sep-tRNA:Cys-tRNA synthetase
MWQEELKSKYGNLKRKNKDLINLNPIQTAGKLTEAAREALVEYGDGYSICDYCKGRLDEIRNPHIFTFIHDHLPKFLDCDEAIVTHGAREGKFMVFHSLMKPGDTIVADQNRHYSTDVAAERAGLKIIEVKNSGDPERLIDVEDYIPLIKKHKPKLVFLTYPDGELGNLPDAERLGEIAGEYDIPYLLNAAYSIGRMPVSMNKIGADFIVGSGHKSMASAGPVGVLGLKKKWEGKILRLSELHANKEIECLGCTVRGVPLITLVASFPYVVERIKNWESEVEKARWFSGQMEELGLSQLGEKPHKHDLIKFETDIFYEISLTHPLKRAFLYEILKENGICGLKHGHTRSMKISTYGISMENLKKVIEVFKGIIEAYKKKR